MPRRKISYTYDSCGNRATMTEVIDNAAPVVTTYTYDAANRLTSENTGGNVTTYTYDASGNVTRKDAPSGLTEYEWDSQNHMTKLAAVEGDYEFSYNADGQRVRKETPTGDVTNYIYDHKHLLMEADGNNATQREYTFTDDEYGDLVAEYDHLEGSRSHLYDAQWSTAALVDDSESATDSYKYTAFGLQEKTAGNYDSHLTYVGKQGYYRDNEVDLYCLGLGNDQGGGRFYDPKLGRFLSEDPRRQQGGDDINLYRYVKNNPINLIDASGNELDSFRRPLNTSEIYSNAFLDEQTSNNAFQQRLEEFSKHAKSDVSSLAAIPRRELSEMSDRDIERKFARLAPWQLASEPPFTFPQLYSEAYARYAFLLTSHLQELPLEYQYIFDNLPDQTQAEFDRIKADYAFFDLLEDNRLPNSDWKKLYRDAVKIRDAESERIRELLDQELARLQQEALEYESRFNGLNLYGMSGEKMAGFIANGDAIEIPTDDPCEKGFAFLRVPRITERMLDTGVVPAQPSDPRIGLLYRKICPEEHGGKCSYIVLLSSDADDSLLPRQFPPDAFSTNDGLRAQKLFVDRAWVTATNSIDFGVNLFLDLLPIVGTFRELQRNGFTWQAGLMIVFDASLLLYGVGLIGSSVRGLGLISRLLKVTSTASRVKIAQTSLRAIRWSFRISKGSLAANIAKNTYDFASADEPDERWGALGHLALSLVFYALLRRDAKRFKALVPDATAKAREIVSRAERIAYLSTNPPIRTAPVRGPRSTRGGATASKFRKPYRNEFGNLETQIPGEPWKLEFERGRWVIKFCSTPCENALARANRLLHALDPKTHAWEIQQLKTIKSTLEKLRNVNPATIQNNQSLLKQLTEAEAKIALFERFAPPRTYTTQSSGTDLIRNATTSGKSVQIKSGHGYNRPHTGPGGVTKDLRQSGLSMDDIENAILDDIDLLVAGGTNIPSPGTAGFKGPLDRTVTVSGEQIGYRVVERPDGTISVGTYFWK